MRKLIAFSLLMVSLFTTIESGFALDEERTYRSVLKIRTYDYNVTNDTYSLSHIGSAVAIGSGLLLTNAHVVFDQAQEKPTGYYEVCRTLDFRKKAVCFTTGELLAYDESSDLAIVRYTQPADLPGVSLFQESKINIGARLVVYGYPGIGGENISRTEGNVAGYEEPFYKIDGAIDHGNSGG
jgi:serine protease Do